MIIAEPAEFLRVILFPLKYEANITPVYLIVKGDLIIITGDEKSVPPPHAAHDVTLQHI